MPFFATRLNVACITGFVSLRRVLGEADANAEAHQAVDAMFEPELLAALLPATDPPVATFREVLGILQKWPSSFLWIHGRVASHGDL